MCSSPARSLALCASEFAAACERATRENTCASEQQKRHSRAREAAEVHARGTRERGREARRTHRGTRSDERQTMGLNISKLFARLLSKQEMRILMVRHMPDTHAERARRREVHMRAEGWARGGAFAPGRRSKVLNRARATRVRVVRRSVSTRQARRRFCTSSSSARSSQRSRPLVRGLVWHARHQPRPRRRKTLIALRACCV